MHSMYFAGWRKGQPTVAIVYDNRDRIVVRPVKTIDIMSMVSCPPADPVLELKERDES